MKKDLFILFALYFIFFSFSVRAQNQLEPTVKTDKILEKIQEENDNEPKGEKIEFENADAAEYMKGEEGQEGIVKLFGRIRIKFPNNSTILANKVIIDTSTQEFYAEGNLTFLSQNGSSIKAERLIYNRNIGQGVLYNAKGYNNPIRFIGKQIRIIGTDRLSINHIRFTTNAASPPHYHFTARSVGLYDDKTFFASNVLYYVGNVPLIGLPFLYSTPGGTGIITQLGRGDIQGNFIQNTYKFGVPSINKREGVLPNAYSFTLDAYQNTGYALGIRFSREADNLDYIFDLGYAKFSRYDYVDGRVSNQVEKCTGNNTESNPTSCSRGEEKYDWRKANIALNSKLNEPEKNHVRNIMLSYKNFGNWVYEYEFGRRFNPTTTFSALYNTLRLDNGLLQPTQGWFISYEEIWDTLSLKIQAKHDDIWISKRNFQDSAYEPSQEILPSITLKKSFILGKIPYFNTNINWMHEINTSVQKSYTDSKEFLNSSLIEYKTNFNFSFPLLNWLYWNPIVGYGAKKNKQTVNSTDLVTQVSVNYEGEKNSYQYLYSENTFGIGNFTTSLIITQRNKGSYKEERADIPEISRRNFNNNQTLNETEFYYYWYALPYLNFNLNTTYDHRAYPQPILNSQRWHYPIFRTDLVLDWLNLFKDDRENLLSRNRVSFIQNQITNDFVYDPVFQRANSNTFGINFQMGGYSTKLLKRLRFFEMGLLWYHVYFNPNLDSLRYVFKTDVQLHDFVYWEFALESRVSEPNRYQSSSVDTNNNPNSVNFFQDLWNGTGLAGRDKGRTAVFNIYALNTGLIIDLQDWEFRLDYEIEQRYIPQTSGNILGTVYYDKRVSFGLNFLRFQLGRSQKPSRFLIDQQRPSF